MYILAIETTGLLCSAAVIDTEGSEPAVMKCGTEPMTHLKLIMTMADQALKEKGVDKSELGAVAVSVGPGSFTGIRIGVSTARAIAQALNIPCISVPTLEEFTCLAGGEGTKPLAVIFNARRGQVYGAVFSETGDKLMEPGPYMLTDVLDFVKEHDLDPVFYGDGIDAYEDQLSGYELADKAHRYQTAAMTAELGAQKAREGAFLTYDQMLPDYMRESEAEQRLKDGSLEKMRKAKLAKFMGR